MLMPKPECLLDIPSPKLGLLDRLAKAYDKWCNSMERDERCVNDETYLILNIDDVEVDNGCRFL